MANGFITLENGKDFFTRWTGYDMIIEIVIRELKEIDPQCTFADWLATQIPEGGQYSGGALFYNAKNEMVQRILDLRELTENNRSLFWQALEVGRNKVLSFGADYSDLNPERINELWSMHKGKNNNQI